MILPYLTSDEIYIIPAASSLKKLQKVQKLSLIYSLFGIMNTILLSARTIVSLLSPKRQQVFPEQTYTLLIVYHQSIKFKNL